MSDKGIFLLTQWEGYSTEVYEDVAGLKTIGVGHLLTKDELTSGKIKIDNKRVKYADGLTKEEVTTLLKQDVAHYERVVVAGIRVPLAQNQFDALCSLCFNIGGNAFLDSSLRRVINDERWEEVPDRIRMWKYSGGKIVQGLINRRENEVRLWLGQI